MVRPVLSPGEIMDAERPTLEEVRARIDAIDAQLLALLDERAALAHAVAEAKRESGGDGKLGIRSAREAQVIRTALARPRQAASNGLVVSVWRELIGESLRIQGPFNLTVWGGARPARTVELARQRFGVAPPLAMAETAEAAIAATHEPGGVAVLALEPNARWWARMLVEPKLNIFACLPDLTAWGPGGAMAVAEVEVEPSGGDQTFWVTDAPRANEAIIESLSRDGVAASLIAESGGLKLFCLAGYFQRHDERLARAPGRLTGVIGAAPTPFDL